MFDTCIYSSVISLFTLFVYFSVLGHPTNEQEKTIIQLRIFIIGLYVFSPLTTTGVLLNHTDCL